MSAPTESYLKVHYELRPAKQVERRMLADSFQLLLRDFPLRDYQYTGMGSVYFIDFILFHRMLGISNMLSVEYSTKVAKRVEFNKPFDCVRTKIAPIGDVIPSLSKDLQHILWLDYDGVLEQGHLADISSAATFLSAGSILLITVDVEPPTKTDEPKDWCSYFKEQTGDFFDETLPLSEFAESKIPLRNVEYVVSAIKSGLVGRPHVELIPMFNFVYKDGHTMLTLGGMIGTPTDREKVLGNRLAKTTYFRKSFTDPQCVIRVPRFTRKERMFLDKFMPCADDWLPQEFEVSPESITAYREIYRYCPSYAELLF